MTLYTDGQVVGSGRVDVTEPMMFSPDKTLDAGCQGGTTVAGDYTANTSKFNGQINWIQRDQGVDDYIVSAAIEVGTGLGMMVLPSLIAALLLGASITTSLELVMARLSGVALLALGVACLLAASDAQSRAARGLAGGMVLYDIGAVAILLYAALGLGLSGVLL